MITYATDETYHQLVSEGIAVVDFFGKTCVPCKMIGRVLEEIEDEFPFIHVIKVDVDECPKTAGEFEVKGIPDLYFYKDGQIVAHEVGAVGTDVIRGYLADIFY